MFEFLFPLVIMPILIGVVTRVISEWIVRKLFDKGDK